MPGPGRSAALRLKPREMVGLTAYVSPDIVGMSQGTRTEVIRVTDGISTRTEGTSTDVVAPPGDSGQHGEGDCADPPDNLARTAVRSLLIPCPAVTLVVGHRNTSRVLSETQVPNRPLLCFEGNADGCYSPFQGFHGPNALNRLRISSSTSPGSAVVWAISARKSWRYRRRSRWAATLAAPSETPNSRAASA